MRIALSSNMNCYSGNTTDKLVGSITSKLSYQRNFSVKYSEACREILKNTLQIPRQNFASRVKCYHPNVAQLIKEWFISCKQCIIESWINRNFNRFSLKNPNEHITAPENAMRIDFVPELPPFGGFENIVTAMNLFAQYLFAYPTSNQDFRKIARVIKYMMTKHAYLPTTPTSDKGSTFMSHVIKKLLASLGLL